MGETEDLKRQESRMCRVLGPGLWVLSILGFSYSQHQYKQDVREGYGKMTAVYRDAFMAVRAEKFALQEELRRMREEDEKSKEPANAGTVPVDSMDEIEKEFNDSEAGEESFLVDHESPEVNPRLRWFRGALEELGENEREIAMAQWDRMEEYRRSLSEQEREILDFGVEGVLKEILDGIESERDTATPEQRQRVESMLGDPSVQDLFTKVAELSALSLMEAEEAVHSARELGSGR